MFRNQIIPNNRVMSRTPSHLYLKPHQALRQWVAHYTITFPIMRNTNSAGCHEGQFLTLLPDASGCFVFSLGEHPTARLWGATTKTAQVLVDYDEAPQRFFIEFRPGGAYQLTGTGMLQLTDALFPLQDVVPQLYHEIAETLYSWHSLGWILQKIDQILLAQMQQPCFAQTDFILPELLKLASQQNNVRQLASASGYSERQLQRLFVSRFGVSPKSMIRVFRINKVLSLLEPGVKLTTIAQQTGYYDQSHLNHDFRMICGTSPGNYLVSISDFYKENFKL